MRHSRNSTCLFFFQLFLHSFLSLTKFKKSADTFFLFFYFSFSSFSLAYSSFFSTSSLQQSSRSLSIHLSSRFFSAHSSIFSFSFFRSIHQSHYYRVILVSYSALFSQALVHFFFQFRILRIETLIFNIVTTIKKMMFSVISHMLVEISSYQFNYFEILPCAQK